MTFQVEKGDAGFQDTVLTPHEHRDTPQVSPSVTSFPLS